MTCPPPIAAAAAVAPHNTGSGRRLAIPTVAASGPAPIIAPPPASGIAAHITGRALSQRHPNAVQRQRFIDLHMTLASRIYSAADPSSKGSHHAGQ